MTALELAALALVWRLMRGDAPRTFKTLRAARPAHDDTVSAPEEVIGDPQPEQIDPRAFLTESAGEGAQYYRAVDAAGHLLAAFYADGRVRLADQGHGLAGILQNGRADLLQIADNTWSELFVRETPEGTMQLELRGGPFDTRVLTCEPIDDPADGSGPKIGMTAV